MGPKKLHMSTYLVGRNSQLSDLTWNMWYEII